MLITFICVMAIVRYFNKRDTTRKDKMLENNIYFKGKVVNIKTSTNHSFGIILISLDSTNTKEFNQPQKPNTFPYKIKNGQAELYTAVPDGISAGDIVIVNSNLQKEFYYYIKSKQSFEGALQMVGEGIDEDYINENSSLR